MVFLFDSLLFCIEYNLMPLTFVNLKMFFLYLIIVISIFNQKFYFSKPDQKQKFVFRLFVYQE